MALASASCAGFSLSSSNGTGSRTMEFFGTDRRPPTPPDVRTGDDDGDPTAEAGADAACFCTRSSSFTRSASTSSAAPTMSPKTSSTPCPVCADRSYWRMPSRSAICASCSSMSLCFRRRSTLATHNAMQRAGSCAVCWISASWRSMPSMLAASPCSTTRTAPWIPRKYIPDVCGDAAISQMVSTTSPCAAASKRMLTGSGPTVLGVSVSNVLLRSRVMMDVFPVPRAPHTTSLSVLWAFSVAIVNASADASQ
mmetsp:Transcript_24238/g.75035  ORF Transcript_24238/g.75035 Transcript_24238/m.75035 type:complete len:253 (-) Transcript_24238:12-770(-)